MKVHLAVLVVLSAALAEAGEIHGKIVSVNRGEPLRQVQVSVLELRHSTTTAEDGTFAIENLPAGKYTLRVSAVGYRLVTTQFEIAGDADSKEFSITLAPDNFHRTDTVDVKGDIFQGENPAVPGLITLNSSELKQASTVLANDPFRAVQALPGVSASANNDFFAEFSVMGAPFNKVSVYFDDVLVRLPFHTLPGIVDGASLSVLSSETVDQSNLMPVAFPAQFADATGSALQLRMREGSRTRPLFTFAPGIADTEATGEGELGRSGKGSWLASARKSYMGWLVHRSGGDPFTDISFQDGSLNLGYNITPRENVSLLALAGHTDINRTDPVIGPNTLIAGKNDFSLARLGWKSAFTSQLLLDVHAGYLRERSEQNNFAAQPLVTETYGEWIGGSRVTWSWLKEHVVEAGYTMRRLRDGRLGFFYDGQGGVQPSVATDGTGLRQTGYAQEVSSFFHQRLHLMAGVRWDQLDQVEAQPVSSQVSAAFQLRPRTQLQFGFGRYAQFPDFDNVAETCLFPPFTFTLPREVVERSDHYTAAIEQRFGENIRLRVQGFDRENQPIAGGRVETPTGCGPLQRNPNPPPFVAFVFPSDYSRGVQLIVQRRSANRLSGWIGYTLDYARQKISLAPGLPPIVASTFEDQRHTLNVFANYRLTSTINLGGKFLYGSGFVIPSDELVQVGNGFVAFPINRQTLNAYLRLDVRVDKSWTFDHWKMTVHAEGLNMTNHNNPRFISESVDVATHKIFPIVEKGLPIVPTAGLTFEF